MPIEKREAANPSLGDSIHNRRSGSSGPEGEGLERRYGKVGISAVAAAIRYQGGERAGETARDAGDSRAGAQDGNADAASSPDGSQPAGTDRPRSKADRAA